eukprot:COSAG05_NODE_3517_length_2014_cov_7.247515_1_plen_161_part_10
MIRDKNACFVSLYNVKAAAALAAKKAQEKAAAAERAAERAAQAEKRRLKAAQAGGGGGKPARNADGNSSRPTSAAKSIIAEGGSRGGARSSGGKAGHREPSLKQRMARQKANNSWKTALLKYIDAELSRLPVFAVNGQPNLATGKAPPAVPKRYQTKLLRQ